MPPEVSTTTESSLQTVDSGIADNALKMIMNLAEEYGLERVREDTYNGTRMSRRMECVVDEKEGYILEIEYYGSRVSYVMAYVENYGEGGPTDAQNNFIIDIAESISIEGKSETIGQWAADSIGKDAETEIGSTKIVMDAMEKAVRFYAYAK